MTETQKPPMKASEEATEKQLDLAKEQGRAYVKALKQMTEDEAEAGGEKAAGDYIVGYAIEKAEGMYHLKDGDLKWVKPERENAHVEVSVRDASDNRFVPGLKVQVTLHAEDGTLVGTHEQPFLWHPWLYHYGRNWTVPADGTYTMRVHIDPPEFMRHDPENGKRYAKPVEVEFKNVKIKTGRK